MSPDKEGSSHSRELLRKLMRKTTLTAALSILDSASDPSKKPIEGYREDPDFCVIYEAPCEPYDVKDGLLHRLTRLCIPRSEVRNNTRTITSLRLVVAPSEKAKRTLESTHRTIGKDFVKQLTSL